ncbi:Fructose-bisphosphate aldolase 1 [Brettanomyces bruxellensis]|uniref:Fructose-bisphosphate aldolase n=1 Tax=Dekkera bruxellensis TaxID=5007 RepID=A0A8H6BBG7_DEKBR|nr:Fructose-bisphosphate aldolase 1 [Brettanomyces bruxellensis]
MTLDFLKRKTGVIVGDDVINLFKYAHQKGFAIPAVNVTSSSTAVAALQAARDNNSPIILQTSNGGAAFFAGKGVSNENQAASIAGAVAAAHYIRSIAPTYGIPVIMHSDHCARKLLPWFDGMLKADEEYFAKHGEPLFSSHMLDLSAENDDYNISTCAKYFKRMAKMDQWLEMEIGITGGEEDGVNNESAEKDALYTSSETVFSVYKALSPISPNFSIAAAFGNVHGVYKPGNVVLRPELLGEHQKYAKKQLGTSEDKPLFLVFHGGSGSTNDEYRKAISLGIVKVNIDTDTQWAYLTGVRDYVLKYQAYLAHQVGNPEGDDLPNKKYYDPRRWVREGEKTMYNRIDELLGIFSTKGQLGN